MGIKGIFRWTKPEGIGNMEWELGLNTTDYGDSLQIRGVILDYGEVLCAKPSEAHLERMANVFGIDPSQFLELYEKNRRAYDRGDLTPEQYWSAFAQSAGAAVNVDQLTQLRAWDVEMWSKLNPVMIEWLHAIQSRGLRTALLSNMHLDMVAKVRSQFSWIRQMDVAVLSQEVRLAKPEPRIYEHCLDRLGTRPAETLFIDDRQHNVTAARALGIRSIRFESVAQLRAELALLEFPALPAA
jgi:putative hydrolase of the HAD superfamily